MIRAWRPGDPDNEKPLPPVDTYVPGALMYFVASTDEPGRPLHGPVSFPNAQGWAERQAVQRATPMDVREVITGVAVLSYNERGRTVWKD